MSYVKLKTNIPHLADALACVAGSCGATDTTQDAMLTSGVAVRLDDDNKAWVASVVQDAPETPQTEILTIVMALDDDGSVRIGSGNVPLARAFWHSADQVTIATRGLDAVRRDLMLMALGEEPDDADEPQAVREQTRRSVAERSIRVRVSVANAIVAPPTDVL